MSTAGFERSKRKRNADGKFSPRSPVSIPKDRVFQTWERVLTVLIESEEDRLETPLHIRVAQLRKVQQGRSRAKDKRIIEAEGITEAKRPWWHDWN